MVRFLVVYDLSVILPVFNDESVLMTSFDSIFNQTLGFENIQLIIVDDCSSDNSQVIIKRLVEKYSNIKYIFLDKNSGSAGKPRNVGINEVDAEYVMFIDCGDTFSNDMCERLLYSIKDTGSDLVFGNTKIIFGDDVRYEKALDKNINVPFNPMECLEIFKNGGIKSKIFKRKIILDCNIKCLEDMFGEDDFFLLSYLFNSSKVFVLKDYFGYNDIIPDFKSNLAGVTLNINFNRVYMYINGYYEVISLLKEHYNEFIYNYWCNLFVFLLITLLSKYDASNTEKIQIMKDIVKLEHFMGINTSLKFKWADLINYFMLNGNFRISIFLSNLIFRIQNINFLKTLYRKILN